MVVEVNDATATTTATTTTTTTTAAAATMVTATAAVREKVDDENTNDDDNNSPPPSIVAKLLLLSSPNKLSSSSLSNNVTTDRKLYEDRLLSFNPFTYYSKPTCLSPIICAGLGWRNVESEVDLLSCSTCNEAVMISINHNLSIKSIENICHLYRQQLATTHNRNCCPFYLSKEQFDRLDGTSDNNTTSNNVPSPSQKKKNYIIVPPYIANKLPEDCLRLMEHPKPSFLLKNRIQDLEKGIITSACNNKSDTNNIQQQQQLVVEWQIPTNELELPSELIQYQNEQLQQEGRGGGSNNNVQLLYKEKVFSNISNFLGTKDVSIAILAMLGWVPIPDDDNDDDIDDVDQNKHDTAEAKSSTTTPTISLGCPLCFSIMEVPLKQKDKQQDCGGEEEDDEEEEEEEPPMKRPKGRSIRNPLNLHRYYCPMVCGFPRNVSDDDIPLWKLLLQRVNKEIIDEEEEEEEVIGFVEDGKEEKTTKKKKVIIDDGDSEFERIRKVLRLGIVPKKVILEEIIE